MATFYYDLLFQPFKGNFILEAFLNAAANSNAQSYATLQKLNWSSKKRKRKEKEEKEKNLILEMFHPYIDWLDCFRLRVPRSDYM